MIKVITYGTYDLLHFGHIRLLERAKELGDYLIVGVTSGDFDITRGKINVQQTLEERIEAVRKTGLADLILIEEYEGQKIDDINKYNVDIFAIGSDWEGKFDYLNEYCKVVYLERTKGISSSELREKNQAVQLGLVGFTNYINKMYKESKFVNGLDVVSLCTSNTDMISDKVKSNCMVTNDYQMFLDSVNAVYIHSNPTTHYTEVKEAILRGKHVLCESPIALERNQCKELFALAKKKNVILMEALRTAYSVAYNRLLLLLKAGKIGKIISVDAVCTSLNTNAKNSTKEEKWGSITAWGPTALLPVFQLLGTKYTSCRFCTKQEEGLDLFTKIDFEYEDAAASVKVGIGVKSEGELIISGTEGYVYVPAPWWKTDYFEIRYEDSTENRRYFYQLDGEGIRYELVEFVKAINGFSLGKNIESNVTEAITDVVEKYMNKENVFELK